jgi:hypothetical protein
MCDNFVTKKVTTILEGQRTDGRWYCPTFITNVLKNTPVDRRKNSKLNLNPWISFKGYEKYSKKEKSSSIEQTKDVQTSHRHVAS